MQTDPFNGQHMGVTAQSVAQKYNVSRKKQDRFAVQSQWADSTRTCTALAEETIPVEIQ